MCAGVSESVCSFYFLFLLVGAFAQEKKRNRLRAALGGENTSTTYGQATTYGYHSLTYCLTAFWNGTSTVSSGYSIFLSPTHFNLFICFFPHRRRLYRPFVFSGLLSSSTGPVSSSSPTQGNRLLCLYRLARSIYPTISILPSQTQ